MMYENERIINTTLSFAETVQKAGGAISGFTDLVEISSDAIWNILKMNHIQVNNSELLTLRTTGLNGIELLNYLSKVGATFKFVKPKEKE